MSDESYSARGHPRKGLAGSSEHVTRLPADHLDKRRGQVPEKSKKAPIGSKSSVQMVDNCPHKLPIKRGRGHPRKQIYPNPSISTEHNHAGKGKMTARVIHSTIQTGQRMNSDISNHMRGVLRHPATNPLPKYCPRGGRFSQRLAMQHTVALKTTSAHITPTKRAQPASHGDHLPRMSRKNMNADEVPPEVGDVNNPQKRGRLRQQLEVEVPCAALCRTCYDEVATLVGSELNSNSIHVKVVSRKPAEDTGIGKRGRGRPRKVQESHWAAFKRKKPIAGL